MDYWLYCRMSNSKFVKHVGVKISKISNNKDCMNNIRNHAVTDHPRVSIFIGSSHRVAKLLCLQNVLDYQVEQKVGVLPLGTTILSYRTDQETELVRQGNLRTSQRYV